jgi:hypothetical protein
MGEGLLRGYVWVRSLYVAVTRRVTPNEHGEGVISTAIAVLVMAFLGVLMWTLFEVTMRDTQSHVNGQLTNIGG